MALPEGSETWWYMLSNVLFLFVLMISCGDLVHAQNGEILQVKSDVNVTFQTIDGFGASDAWHAQFIGKIWPLDKRNQIADLLFSQEFDKDGDPKASLLVLNVPDLRVGHFLYPVIQQLTLSSDKSGLRICDLLTPNCKNSLVLYRY